MGEELTELTTVDLVCSGLYLADCQFGEFAAEHARDYETARRLWHLSEDLIGEEFPLE